MKLDQLKDIQLGSYVPVLSSPDEEIGGKVDVDSLKDSLDGRYLRLAASEKQTVESDVAYAADLDVGESMRQGKDMATVAAKSFAGGEEGCATGFRGYRVVDVDEDASTLTILTPVGHATASPSTLDGIKAGAWISFYARRCGTLETSSEPNFGVTFQGVVSSDGGKTKIKLSKIPEQLFAYGDRRTPWFKCFNPTDQTQYLVYVFFPDNGSLGQNTAAAGAKQDPDSEYETSPDGLAYGELIDIDEPATSTSGIGSMSYGYKCTAGGDNSIAVGCQASTLGRYAAAIGLNCIAAGKNSFALGSANVAAGAGSIALGGCYPANSLAMSMGRNVENYAKDAFAWSGTSRGGDSDGTRYVVPDSRQGTFNVNPIGGLSGVYVGESSLADQVVDVSSNQEVSGRKRFTGGLVVGGDQTPALGNDVFGVGSSLTLGANNWYWKCIDLSIDSEYDAEVKEWLTQKTAPSDKYHAAIDGTFQTLSGKASTNDFATWLERCGLPDKPIYTARVFLSDKQPAYPGPFVMYNGVSSMVRMNSQTLSARETSTYPSLSAEKKLLAAWNCEVDTPRSDYNRFASDGVDYKADNAAIWNALDRYIKDAMTPDASLEKYGLKERAVGQEITLVNDDKMRFRRCMKVKSVDETGSVLTVEVYPSGDDCKLKKTAYQNEFSNLDDGAVAYLLSHGAGIADFAPDDSTLVFVDSPAEAAPVNTSAYGSANIGEKNVVLRRCSLAAGKNNRCEQDFAIALGRSAEATHYCSFVWAPSVKTSSPGTGTFTVGTPATKMSTAVDYSRPGERPMYMGVGGRAIPMHRYMLACMIEELKHSKQMRELLQEALASEADELSAEVAGDMA